MRESKPSNCCTSYSERRSLRYPSRAMASSTARDTSPPEGTIASASRSGISTVTVMEILSRDFAAFVSPLVFDRLGLDMVDHHDLVRHFLRGQFQPKLLRQCHLEDGDRVGWRFAGGRFHPDE